MVIRYEGQRLLPLLIERGAILVLGGVSFRVCEVRP